MRSATAQRRRQRRHAVPNDLLLNELYAAHEIFRRLGYLSEEIFVMPDAEGIVAVVLRVIGKEASLIVGRSGSVDTLLDEWRAMATRINSGALSEDELQRILFGSQVYGMRHELLVNLGRAGLYPINRDRVWS